MILAKTEKGRASLSQRRALLPRERQLLVLADGRRGRHELAGLLGFDIDATVARLMRDGYLMRADLPSERAAGDSAERLPGTQGPAPSEALASRQSLAASKMYMIGLLQMLRDAEAVRLAVSLHGAQDADELRQTIVEALVFVHRRSGAEYAARVAQQVLEMFPQGTLPALCESLAQTQLPALVLRAAAWCGEPAEDEEALA